MIIIIMIIIIIIIIINTYYIIINGKLVQSFKCNIEIRDTERHDTHDHVLTFEYIKTAFSSYFNHPNSAGIQHCQRLLLCDPENDRGKWCYIYPKLSKITGAQNY
jgi:hypothetical protein